MLFLWLRPHSRPGSLIFGGCLGGLLSLPVVLGRYSRINGMFRFSQRCSAFPSSVMQIIANPISTSSFILRNLSLSGLFGRKFRDPRRLEFASNLFEFAKICFKFVKICSNLLQICSIQHFTTLLQHIYNTSEANFTKTEQIGAK